MLFFDGRPGKPDALPCNPAMSWGVRDVAKLKGCVLHHTAGVNDHPRNTAAYHVAPNHTSAKGMPGLAYTFFVRRNGDVWQANDLDQRTWSHGGGKTHPDVDGDGAVTAADGQGNANATFLAIVVAGSFDSRWNKTGIQPTPEQLASVMALWLHLVGYSSASVLPFRLFGAVSHLGIGDLWGHADLGKAACPGDRLLTLAEWMREGRRSSTPRSVSDWQLALVEHGHFLGTFGPTMNGVDGQWGPATRAALRKFQASEGLAATGDRDSVTAARLFS